MTKVPYDELGLFHENAEEFGLPYDGPPTVRRASVDLGDGRSLSALVWGDAPPELVLLHGGAQNAHTWDTVALALDRPLVAIDLPGHGHSDGPTERSDGGLEDNARDVAATIRDLAPEAKVVVGMSLGGLTTIALTHVAPELVRSVVLVDVTPGVNDEKAKAILDFVDGPETFADFDELLERTKLFNPTRSESSLRRGILHNALQRDDGTWVWRYRRFPVKGGQLSHRIAPLWDWLGEIRVPLMLVRGLRDSSVVTDEDEAELLRRQPTARVEHVAEAGHSVQGDDPLTLARLLAELLD